MVRKGVLLLECLLLCFYSVCGEVCVPGNLPDFTHDIEGRLCFVDQKTLVIRGFSYDGRGPDTFLYYYGSGFTADTIPDNGGGDIIPHPQTLDKFPSGERIRDEDFFFSLPDDVYACDMVVFTIWCKQANTHFTAIDIPPDLFSTVPEEGKILCNRVGGSSALSFENCEQLDNSLSVSWTVNTLSENVIFMLCGCTFTQRGEENIWLGFGLSGSSDETLMRGADVSIVWVDEVEGPQAVDYYLSEYTQCRLGLGACPDTSDSSGECFNDVTLLQGFRQDGQQCVAFSRNFSAGDVCDLELDPDLEEQYIVWGIGGLGETAFRHFIRADRGDPPLHLGRESLKNCEPLQCISCPAYQNQRMTAPSDTTFVAHIGPSGDQRGYTAITGNPGWGIAWYINGTLIPELVVERNQRYTFVVYGGDDSAITARYHPLYITSSETGGRALNTEEQRDDETVYGGLEGEDPLGVGPLCEYQSNEVTDAVQENCLSLLCNYEAALTEPTCDESAVNGNVFTWTPDDSTPDLVYYQCLTHQNLGGKIRVTDSVEEYVAVNSWPDIPTTCPDVPTTDPDVPTTDPELSGSPSLSHPFLLSLLLINLIARLFY